MKRYTVKQVALLSGVSVRTIHPDFQPRFNAIQNGFAAYLVPAMRAWGNRQPPGV